MKSDGSERERERDKANLWFSRFDFIFEKKKKTIYYRLGLGNI